MVKKDRYLSILQTSISSKEQRSERDRRVSTRGGLSTG